jgi:23S rRNA pseudouridine2605 synthase
LDTSNSGGEKLQKVLARAGIGSRRDMEKLIGANRVTVNGKIAHLGDRVEERDRILVDGHPIALKAADERRARVLIYNKPEGEICSVRDPEGRPTVFDRLPALRGERWISIGRLDFNTSGLLLFTTDGELANALMHPSANIDREYLCRVLGEVDEDMQERLRRGVVLEDGIARFTDITSGGSRKEDSANRWFYVCLMEGRNREVRRLWESQDVKVSRLKRVRYGPVFLPGRLKQGQWEEMPLEQLAQLYAVGHLPVPALAPWLPEDQQKLDREQRKNRPAPRSAGPRGGAVQETGRQQRGARTPRGSSFRSEGVGGKEAGSKGAGNRSARGSSGARSPERAANPRAASSTEAPRRAAPARSLRPGGAVMRDGEARPAARKPTPRKPPKRP